MAASVIDEDFKRTMKERKEYWEPIEKGLKDLEDALKEGGFGDAEPHFKRLTYYLDKCKDTSDFEYHWSELKNTVEKPAVQKFQVIGDQAVVDFIEKNPDYFHDFKEVVIEPPRKKQRGRPARFKSGQVTKTDPALELANELLKNERQKEAVFSNERGTLNKPYLIAVTRGKRDRLPQFYVNIDGLIRAIRVDHINLSGAFMAKCCGFMGPSKCKARHKIQITNKNLYHMIEAGDAGRERYALKENASQLFDRSSYEMVPHDSITGVSNLSPLCKHTCDEVSIEEVIAKLKKKGHIDESETLESLTKNDNSSIVALGDSSDTDSLMEIDEFHEELERKKSEENDLVVEGVGRESLPHLVAVTPGVNNRLRPRFFLDVCNKLYEMRHETLNLDGVATLICKRRSCPGRYRLQVTDQRIYCKESGKTKPEFLDGIPNVFNRNSYEFETSTKIHAHTCGGDEITYEEIRAKLSDVQVTTPKSLSDILDISNERGTLNLPHLVAVTKSRKGRLPKFFINIDGDIRAVRLGEQINSSGGFMAKCCSGKCKSRHKMQVTDENLFHLTKCESSQSDREKYALNEDAPNRYDRSSYKMIAYDSITGVSISPLSEHTCDKIPIKEVIAILKKNNQVDEDEMLESLTKNENNECPEKRKHDFISEISYEPELMYIDENITEETRRRNESKEDDLVVEGVGQVSLPHLIAVAPGKIVQTRPKFYVNICNKFFEMHQETLNLDGGVTLVCKKRDCSAKSKLRILDETMIAKEPGKRAPSFVEGCPNVFNRNFYEFERFDKTQAHTCDGEDLSYEEIRFKLSNVRVITPPKRLMIENGDPNAKPSTEILPIQSGKCMGCCRTFSSSDLLIEHILKSHRCSDTYVLTYATHCFICLKEHKALRTHFRDTINGGSEISTALKNLHIDMYEVYSGEPWQSKLVNRVEILPSKLRRSVLGNSLNEDKIFEQSTKGFTCYTIESGQCSSCHDSCDSWEGLLAHLEDQRYYLCREYYLTKEYCFICSKFYSKVSQHFNDVKRGKGGNFAGKQTLDIHNSFLDRFIIPWKTNKLKTPRNLFATKSRTADPDSSVVTDKRGNEIVIPTEYHPIVSGKCSMCSVQFENWRNLIAHIRGKPECKEYYVHKYITFCFICARPFKQLKGHINDCLSGKVITSPDERKMHELIKPIYIPNPKPKSKQVKRRTKPRKADPENSSDEDESFKEKRPRRKKMREEVHLLGKCSSKNMIEQVVEGDGTSLVPHLTAITVGIQRSPRFYITIAGNLRVLRCRSFSYQKETFRMQCVGCRNVYHSMEVVDKSLILHQGTKKATIDMSNPKIFDVNSYAMLPSETNEHGCSVSITKAMIRGIQRGEIEPNNLHATRDVDTRDIPAAPVEKRTTPKRASSKQSHNESGESEEMEIDDDEDSQDETTISDEESDGLDEESEPDSDELMDSTEHSATESPMKSAESSRIDVDENMSDKAEDEPVTSTEDNEPQKTVNTDKSEKEISFHLDTSSETNNPDNSSL